MPTCFRYLNDSDNMSYGYFGQPGGPPAAHFDPAYHQRMAVQQGQAQNNARVQAMQADMQAQRTKMNMQAMQFHRSENHDPLIKFRRIMGEW